VYFVYGKDQNTLTEQSQTAFLCMVPDIYIKAHYVNKHNFEHNRLDF